MKIIADLHLHSKYSRAVSPEMVLDKIAQWAVKKGIGLMGTGDWTHPLWLREIKANLEEVAPGLYGLKSEDAAGYEFSHPEERAEVAPLSGVPRAPLFILSTEISSIYSQGGKLHRIHNLILAPSIEVVEKINQALVNRGANLMSDGRPITGIPAPELVKIILDIDERSLIIPAHAWTPWFSLYGSQSGFDSIDECFGEMAKYIYAVETGLSSDPAMNWRIGELDKRAIVSFSDAHSGPKLGREATVFEMGDISYDEIRKALLSGGQRNQRIRTSDLSDISDSSGPPSLPTVRSSEPQIAYTLEFYPEEGKYHYTGHRDCGIKQSPEETKKLGEICPVCGKHLTIGVMHRVQQLATRETEHITLNTKNDEFGVKWIRHEDRPPYAMLVPLQEILAESLGGLPASKNVQNEYEKLVNAIRDFGGFGEFEILLKTPIEQIAKVSGEKVAEGIKKVREGSIVVEPGYDGVFGIVKIWSFDSAQDKAEDKEQMSLF